MLTCNNTDHMEHTPEDKQATTALRNSAGFGLLDEQCMNIACCSAPPPHTPLLRLTQDSGNGSNTRNLTPPHILGSLKPSSLCPQLHNHVPPPHAHTHRCTCAPTVPHSDPASQAVSHTFLSTRSLASSVRSRRAAATHSLTLSGIWATPRASTACRHRQAAAAAGTGRQQQARVNACAPRARSGSV